MEGGTEIMDESRQSELGRSTAAADRVVGLEDFDRASLPRKLDRGGKTVGTAANDDRIRPQRPRTRRLIFDHDAAAVITSASSMSPAATTSASPSRNRAFEARRSAARRASSASTGRIAI